MASRRVMSSIPTTKLQQTLKPSLQTPTLQASISLSRPCRHIRRRDFSNASRTMAPYPTQDEIRDIFKHMETGNYSKTFERVRADVDWTVMGTHPLAGHYTSLKDFQQHTLARLAEIMKDPGLKLTVRNVIGGGEHAWSTVELLANAECLNGFKFDNTYAWCMRFDESGQVAEVRAYLDSQMVKQAIEENEQEEDERRSPVLAS